MSTVLIIDDEPLIVSLLKEILLDLAYVVVTAKNGLEGIKQERKYSVDLIITDIIMPELDGIEMIKQLKLKKPKLPIIAISGGATLNNQKRLEDAKKLGVYYCFNKPFNLGEISSAVKNCLDDKS